MRILEMCIVRCILSTIYSNYILYIIQITYTDIYFKLYLCTANKALSMALSNYDQDDVVLKLF